MMLPRGWPSGGFKQNAVECFFFNWQVHVRRGGDHTTQVHVPHLEMHSNQ